MRITIQKWRWLYAPSRTALGFASRTGVASIIALYIALWMEMSDPFWAPLTVWMVALLTPEESNAKARWHLFGTIFGAISAVVSVACFPQQAALFIIVLAFWVGCCCFLASFLNNFRIHGMRASSFTFALIAMDAIPNPNQVFDIAMSRASYIILAIILQKTATSICVGDQKIIRLEWLRENLSKAIEKTCQVLSSFYQGNTIILQENKGIFANFYRLGQQSEFADMAIAPNSRLGAHGRMILAIANNILFRTFCIQKLTPINQLNRTISIMPEEAAAFFKDLPNLITSNIDVHDTLTKIKKIKFQLRDRLHETAELLFINSNSARHYELLFAEISLIRDSLSHLEFMFIQFSNHTKSEQKLYPTYHINTYRNFRKAFSNGVRIFISIILASLIWDITAWEDGILFVMYVAIIGSNTAITERPEKASKSYFIGGMFAVGSTFLINFVLIPPVSNFEILVAIFLPFTFIAGLASCNPAISLTGIAFNFLFPILVSYNNQGRTDEVTYFNLCLALISAILFIWVSCRLLFPVNNTIEYFFTCKQMIHNLAALPRKYFLPPTQKWIDQQISNLVYIINDTKDIPQENQDICFYGAQSIILIGEQVILIRNFLRNEKNTPQRVKILLNSILHKISKRKLAVNTQSLNDEFDEIVSFISTIEDNTTKHKYMSILSAMSIIRCQLYNYEKFVRLYSLSIKRYIKL